MPEGVTVLGYLVRAYIPLSDVTDLTTHAISTRFKNGWVKQETDATITYRVMTWVDAQGAPKVVSSQAEALRLAQQMGQVITRRLLQANARYPVPT